VKLVRQHAAANAPYSCVNRMKVHCYMRRLHGTRRSVDSQVSEGDAQGFAVHDHCILRQRRRRAQIYKRILLHESYLPLSQTQQVL